MLTTTLTLTSSTSTCCKYKIEIIFYDTAGSSSSSSHGWVINQNLICRLNKMALYCFFLPTSVTNKKSPNVYKSAPKMISLEKWRILTPLQKLYNNVSNLGKIIIATGFEWLPKKQKIAQSGHTAHRMLLSHLKGSFRLAANLLQPAATVALH